jgi:hypothetical protein
MIPKKPIILYKQVAEDLNQSESLVDTFMTFYYKEVRKLLSDLSYTKINIDGLGQLVVKERTIDGLINKYNARVNKTTTNTFSNYFDKKNLEVKLEKMNRIKVVLQQEKQLKERFLKDKADGKTGEDLEE